MVSGSVPVPAEIRVPAGEPAHQLHALTAVHVGQSALVLSAPDDRLPALDFAGAPSGIDVLKVLDTGVLPVINTGIAHRRAGVGQIGAGIVTAPPEVFTSAVRRLAAVREVSA